MCTTVPTYASTVPDIVQNTISRLADRKPGRTEANVQSDLHTLLTVAPFNLDDHHVEDIVLESQAGQRRRIDVEVGSTVFEVKRDLRAGGVREDAVEQLAGYVSQRSAAMNARYVGVLTDGCEWHLYRLDADGTLILVSSLLVDTADPDVETLVVWLEGVLATASQVLPKPREVKRRLGADGPGFRLDVADLEHLYEGCRSNPEVVLKRELWARLLFAALGTNFTNDDALFVAHTYLVLVAELVAHAVVGIDLTHPELDVAAVLSGDRFTQAGIGGVVEPDFFDWPAEAAGGEQFVRSLGRRIARFDWAKVDHDVLKTLYESVIDEQTRHRLGEYYTPDWLAQHIVEETVDDPLNQRVLDPACGSGTFLFWAIRRYLAAADAAGIANRDAVSGVADRVVGIDLHPVAVTLARVTYLMAIGNARLQDRNAFGVPVYLGDSVQLAEDTSILDAGGITIPTTADQQEFFAQQIHFPAAVVQNAATFDPLVAKLAEKARTRTKSGDPPSITAVMNQAEVAAEDREAIEKAYDILCKLHKQRRDHVWGYYIRNLARPIWLSVPGNRADRLVGNPPWLRFNAMSVTMQENFRRLSVERGLWAGAAVATSQDLASLFVARSVELYLRLGGRFGFVMPASTLSRSHYGGFRSGQFNAPVSQTIVAYDRPWELSDVRPQPFPVPSCVVRGTRTEPAKGDPMVPEADWWRGAIVDHHRTWAEVEPLITQVRGPVAVDDRSSRSAYGDLMRQGSNLVPRVLLTVDELPPPAMGLPVDSVMVTSHRTIDEKSPWKDLPALEQVLEQRFIRRIHLGETLMPFRLLEPWRAVVPFWNGAVLGLASEELDDHPGLAQWWRKAEGVWVANRRATTTLSLAEQIDYQSKLTIQHPPAPFRVIYSGRGSRVAAAVESDTTTLIDHALYWAPVASEEEGLYLSSLLNSDVLHLRTEAYYSRGLLGARNIHKAAFGVPIPVFDPELALHTELVSIARKCSEVVAALVLTARRTGPNRKMCRDALTASGMMDALNSVVDRLIPPA